MSIQHEVVALIVLATAVRFVDFTAPYTSQHWIKQLQVAPIAANFHHHGYNILWPETDYSADTPAYIEIEFQAVAFLTALLYNVFGIHEWVGRLVTIGFSVAAMILLYRLMLAELGPRPAVLGLLFFAFAPSNWYFSRCLMSEPAMLCLSIATICAFRSWLTLGGAGRLLLTATVAALCFLVKLPTVLLLVPLLYLAYRRYGWGLFRQPALYLLLTLALAPPIAYYLFARYVIGAQYFTVGVGFGGGMWFSLKDLMLPGNYSLMLNRLVKDHLTAVGLVLLPLGLFVRPTLPSDAEDTRSRGFARHTLLFHAWFVGVLAYLVVVSGGNLRQNYYQLPLIPAAAGLVGLAWDRLAAAEAFRRSAIPVLGAVFVVLAVWGVQPMFEQYRPIREASAALAQLDPSGEPVIVFPPGYGCLYYFDRPGWCGREALGRPLAAVRPEDTPGPLYIENRRQRGARWAVYFDVQAQEARPDLKAYLGAHYPTATATGDYLIYDLHEPLREPGASTATASEATP